MSSPNLEFIWKVYFGRPLIINSANSLWTLYFLVLQAGNAKIIIWLLLRDSQKTHHRIIANPQQTTRWTSGRLKWTKFKIVHLDTRSQFGELFQIALQNWRAFPRSSPNFNAWCFFWLRGPGTFCQKCRLQPQNHNNLKCCLKKNPIPLYCW